ncbi:MAG: neutral/alkaline non-lysosomal ceramidase N-terminal domain-containing protein, partial [Alphaproteobacteria bacterium]
MRLASSVFLALSLTLGPALAEDRCEAPAPHAVTAKPRAAAPLAPEIYQHFYGPRDAEITQPYQEKCSENKGFYIGVGKGDITGPANDQGMAGYADPFQTSQGLQDRQWARATILSAACAPEQRIALVAVDLGLMYHGVRQEVVKRLSPRFHYENLMIGATHSHATAAGQSHHDLYNISTGGHDAQAFEGLVSGIVRAIEKAEKDLKEQELGEIFFAQSELLNTSVQRSMEAYLQNPESDRKIWKDVENQPVTINRNAITLRLEGADGPKGLLNFFGVHATSFGQGNRHLSGDNKGWAAQAIEKQYKNDFVAAFFQADEGDSSPNVHIIGLDDDTLRDWDSPDFMARGGGRNDVESTFISAQKQARHALQHFENKQENLVGPVLSAHAFIDMRKAHVEGAPQKRTCAPAYGFGAAAGAEDGRQFIGEGWQCSKMPFGAQTIGKIGLWAALTLMPDVNVPEGALQYTGCGLPERDPNGPYSCHGEKPILSPLDFRFGPTNNLNKTDVETQRTGLTAPIIPFQTVLVGNLAIIALPFEVTTMAARKIRAAVLDELQGMGVDYAVVSGLANGYAHYLTTPEEYDLQLYEGGSTIFGRHSLDVVLQEVTRLARRLKNPAEPAGPFTVADYKTAVTPFIHTPDTEDRGDAKIAYGTITQQAPKQHTVSSSAPAIFAMRSPNPRSTSHGRDITML